MNKYVPSVTIAVKGMLGKYSNLFTPDENGKLKANICIPKSDKKEVKKLMDALKEAHKTGVEMGMLKEGTDPFKISVLHDADNEVHQDGTPYADYQKGHIVLTPWTFYKEDDPLEVSTGKDKRPAKPNEVVPGNICWFILNIKPYQYDKKVGLGAYLQKVARTANGTPFVSANREKVNSLFDSLVIEEDAEEYDITEEELLGIAEEEKVIINEEELDDAFFDDDEDDFNEI